MFDRDKLNNSLVNNTFLVRCVPIIAGSYINQQWYRQISRTGHNVYDFRFKVLYLVIRYFEHQFIMYLHDEPDVRIIFI